MPPDRSDRWAEMWFGWWGGGGGALSEWIAYISGVTFLLKSKSVQEWSGTKVGAYAYTFSVDGEMIILVYS